MWVFISRFILRNRVTILLAMGLFTAFMALQIPNIERDFKITGILPQDHPVTLEHHAFIDQYGHDGAVVTIGIQTDSLFQLDVFNDWRQLGKDLSAIHGIDSVFSIANLYSLQRNDKEHKFEVAPIVPHAPGSQQELDSLKRIFETLPFYSNLIQNDSAGVHVMMVFLDGAKFNSDQRETEVEDLVATTQAFGAKHNIRPRYSGMPYIRTVMTAKVKDELNKFIILAFGVTALILLLFFRSFKVVFFCMLVVSVGVVVSLGTMALFQYKLSMLMGLIPPLIIVIGIPNCVYLLNKYQAEYKLHGNKIKALSRVIQKVGNATFMTNMTTSLGFATFIFTQSSLLQEFGVIAAINIIAVFVLSILLIPIVFSYLPGPGARSTRHLETRWLQGVVEFLLKTTTEYRKTVYTATIVLVGLGIYGLTKVQTTGNMVDDLPYDDPILKDLRFFETHFNGVMPFEILVDTKEPKRAVLTSNLKKIEALQKLLASYPQFSRSMSIADAIKFAHQSFFNDPERYVLPDRSNTNGQMRALLSGFIKNTTTDANSNIGKAFLDSSMATTRIAVSIADIGTIQMDALLLKLRPEIDSIFNPDRAHTDAMVERITAKNVNEKMRDSLVYDLFENNIRLRRFMVNAYYRKDTALGMALDDYPDTLYTFAKQAGFNEMLTRVSADHYYDISLTGTSIVFLEGTSYLVNNLFVSLMIAICLIALLMAVLFNSFRMVLVSLIPNLIPLLFTGAIMGYFGIPIKPSTILVFSIAFGISIDDTIHFLAKYRQELKMQSWDIRGSVLNALRETAVSMIYTSIILFFGFSMFSASSFGGIVALGILVSVTLLLAMFTNLVLLPSLLLSLEKAITTKAFKEPFLEIIDEEEDIELEELVVKKNQPEIKEKVPENNP